MKNTKEFDTYYKYFDDEINNCDNVAFKKLVTINDIIGSNNIELLDIEITRATMNEICDALFIRKRFILLREKSGYALKSSREGFELDFNVYFSLDDVEKALQNRIFA